jgi:hypothetical protein
MFAVATRYDTLAPGLCLTQFSEVAWEAFFRAVKDNRMVSATYRDSEYSCFRVEYENGNFKFSDI